MDLQIIQNLKNEAISQILQAKGNKELEEIKIAYLGRKGRLTELIKEIPKLDPQKRSQAGQSINDAKRAIEESFQRAKKEASPKLGGDIDVTAPAPIFPRGHLHLITQTIEEISRIFEKIGFIRVQYPEVEWDWYAFEGLNMPANHPARDEWETFFIKDLKNPKLGSAVLTPHTSSGQLREMETRVNPPLRMLNIAKCYRRQSDLSHAPMFYQFEGLLIDRGVSISHLKGTLDYFVREYFGKDRQTRIRPFHFQFTEPSFEVDVSCLLCGGQGCKACKEGWMELGGSGMVHPNVLKNGGLDPTKFSGFAWGWGVERLLMMKHAIPDIRLLFGGDLRFLQQF